MTPDDIERFMHRPIYSWDVSNLLSGVVDFLDFSERNLAWQRRREVARAQQEAANLQFEQESTHLLAQAQAQIVESAEYRFDLGLSQAVRQAGLVAYVAALEWCARLFSTRLVRTLPQCPRGKNEAVHLFEQLDRNSGSGFTLQIEQLQTATFFRNCIVHSAGQPSGYKFEADLRATVAKSPGFSLTTESFIGESIHIDAGTVDALAKDALKWVPEMDERCSTNGMFGAMR